MVRLYLSSYRLGADPSPLRSLCGNGRRAGVCMNAGDIFEDPSRIWDRERADLESLGFEVGRVDLRDYFGDPHGLRQQLMTLDLLWVVGGNTFVLARAMRASGFATVGTELVAAGELTYAGYSAGVCAITPDLEGVHLMDEPLAIPAGYPVDATTDALGWVPWRVVPHWRSDHGESGAAELAVEYLLNAELPFRTLQDGHAIVVNGAQIDLVDRT